MNADLVVYKISPPVSNEELNQLFAAAWQGHKTTDFQPILTRSLAYICAFQTEYAFQTESLIGFVNVAWDGGVHTFLLDTTVHPQFQRQGIGQALVAQARLAASERNMEWLHVDFEPHLREFYHKCGFAPTAAGLIKL